VALTGERLPCGTELEHLIAQVADGAAPDDQAHQQRCPYCQAALRDLAHGWSDLRALADDPVTIPRGLAARIMAHIAKLAEHSADAVLLGGRRGETRISHRVVARVAQRAAATVPGLAFASAKAVAHDPPLPRRLSLTIRIVATFGPPLGELADRVRATVRRRVPDVTGADLDRVDIEIEDLVEPDS
jgi:uncharacterized alkaline shock family protein YloU